MGSRQPELMPHWLVLVLPKKRLRNYAVLKLTSAFLHVCKTAGFERYGLEAMRILDDAAKDVANG